ncbi:hypothetical protein MMC11_002919 [Xylographa trunciseda]|nr:hypothetical protein [Xylographa trunciseda]
MPKSMQNIDPSLRSNLSDEINVSQETAGPSEPPTKRERSPGKSPEPGQASGIRKNNKKLKAQVSNTNDLYFACPLFKLDPNKYGGKDGCTCYVKKDIGSMLRHHVIETHRNLNKQTGDIDDAVFESLKNINVKNTKLDKQQRAEETWRKAYEILAQASASEVIKIPSPYYESIVYLGDHAIILTEANVERLLRKHNANDTGFRVEAQNLISKREQLEAERNKQQVKVYALAQAEDMAVRKKCTAQIMEIENRFQTELRDTRQHFTSRLVSQPNGNIESDTYIPPGSAFEAASNAYPLLGINEHARSDRMIDARGVKQLTFDYPSPPPRWPPSEHDPFGSPDQQMLQ